MQSDERPASRHIARETIPLDCPAACSPPRSKIDMTDLAPSTSLSPPSQEIFQIRCRYLLLQGSTPVYIDRSGRRWLERLWAIDAKAHVDYLSDFSIVCPEIAIETPSDQMVAIEGDTMLSKIRFITVPLARSRAQSILQIPRTIVQIWRAIGATDIVHMGVAGWPYPLGWIGMPIAKLRRKKVIVVVESAPWRKTPGASQTLGKKLEASLYEKLARLIVRRGDLRFFTTDSYRQSLDDGLRSGAHVVEASWIPEDQVIEHLHLEERLSAVQARSGEPVRLAFFGRLTQDKGVLFLLDAMRQIAPRAFVTLDIYGEGPEFDRLESELATDATLAAVHLRGTLNYGKQFFDRLRDYDYAIVPSFGDEQPRIVYDAYSQGVPILASSTAGLRQCVQEGITGLFFEPGSVESFASLEARITSKAGRSAHAKMAHNGAHIAAMKTHAAMHRGRARIIASFLEQ
jgi:glycosyltransferase involved in cell wall biosynthesis